MLLGIQTDRQTDRPESHLNGQNLDEVVYSEYIGLVWVIRILYPHHRGNLLNHGPLLPLPIVLFKVNLVGNEACVQLLCHDGSLQYTPVGRVNQVSVSCHHEANKSDTHSVFVEEDVGMGAVYVCGGGKRRGGNRIAVWTGKKVDKDDITASIVARVPVFPLSAFHNLVLLQVSSSTQCCWGWFSSFFSQHLSMQGGCSKVLHVCKCVNTHNTHRCSSIVEHKIFPQAVYTKQS